MALFKYNDYRVDAGQNWEEPGGSSPGWKVSKCPYCSSDKVKIIDEFDDPIDSSESRYASAIAVCTMCGWWEQNDHVYWMGNKAA